MWNNFDFWVVVLSILGGSGLVPGLGNHVQLFRLLRLLRVLKLLKMVVARARASRSAGDVQPRQVAIEAQGGRTSSGAVCKLMTERLSFRLRLHAAVRKVKDHVGAAVRESLRGLPQPTPAATPHDVAPDGK